MRKFILLIPLIYIMPLLFSADKTTAVYMAEPVADFIAVTFTAIFFTFQFKKASKGSPASAKRRKTQPNKGENHMHEVGNEGHGIYANIRKVVGFLLGTNIGEVITVFAAMLLWHRSPLLSMQLLWINLVTDSLPAIALGMEEVEPGVMRQKPKPKDEGIFAHGLGVRVVLQGLMFGILSLAAFWIGWQSTGDLAGGQTLAFMTLALSQVVQAFNMRSDRSLFKMGFFTNRRLNLACLLSVVLVALVLFTPVSIAFGLITLSPQLYLIGLGLSLVPFVVMELSKAFGSSSIRSNPVFGKRVRDIADACGKNGKE